MATQDTQDVDPFQAYLYRILNAHSFETSISAYDGPLGPHTDNILSKLTILRQHVPAVDGSGVNDTVLDAQPQIHVSGKCPTCGRGPLKEEPPTSFASVEEELRYLRSQNQEQVQELQELKFQVPDVARVCNAVARGDLTQKITVNVQGTVMVQLKDVINTMVDKLRQFAQEVTRVSQEFFTAGTLGGQPLEGIWRELTHDVDKLAANYTLHVRSIARVTKAVALGDLSKLIEVDAHGELLDLKNTVNGMVMRLRTIAAEVTRVTLEVGVQGKLGGQAYVPDAEGVWYELVRCVNRTCSSLASQVRTITVVTTAVAQGDLTQRIEIQAEGEMSTLNHTINSMVDGLSAFASEVTRVALEVGTQGILGGQAKVDGLQGAWADLTRNVNKMASNTTDQVRSISKVAKAVASGDLSKVVDVDVHGEMLDLNLTVNSMVAQLGMLANEVTRVSLEVGTEGILGGQAHAPDLQGIWKVLVDHVNLMAMNFTNQVRSIAEVMKAVANGDLTKKIKVEVRGEMLELKETVNEMTERLNDFADEVIRVAREAGTEGRLGGQARVEGVHGTWKDLTDSVNAMAANFK